MLNAAERSEAGSHEDLEEASEVVLKRSPTSWVALWELCEAEWEVALADAGLATEEGSGKRLAP
jgi:hypothetical protein